MSERDIPEIVNAREYFSHIHSLVMDVQKAIEGGVAEVDQAEFEQRYAQKAGLAELYDIYGSSNRNSAFFAANPDWADYFYDLIFQLLYPGSTGNPFSDLQHEGLEPNNQRALRAETFFSKISDFFLLVLAASSRDHDILTTMNSLFENDSPLPASDSPYVSKQFILSELRRAWALKMHSALQRLHQETFPIRYPLLPFVDSEERADDHRQIMPHDQFSQERARYNGNVYEVFGTTTRLALEKALFVLDAIGNEPPQLEESGQIATASSRLYRDTQLFEPVRELGDNLKEMASSLQEMLGFVQKGDVLVPGSLGEGAQMKPSKPDTFNEFGPITPDLRQDPPLSEN